MSPESTDPQGSLSQQLLDARRRTRLLTDDLEGPQLFGPKIEIVNPVLWELGHIAWFQERWCLRLRADESLSGSLLEGADPLYDSAKVVHGSRWGLPLPGVQATRDYLERVLQGTLERLSREPDNEWFRYFAQLVLYHEDMHAEALHYARQTLGYADPLARGKPPGETEKGAVEGNAELPGGEFLLGAARNSGFHFDNEKWAHRIELKPFRIARAPVTNAQFLEFVREGGYGRRDLWSPEGWTWKARAQAPRYWIEREGEWWERRFDKELPLARDLPVMHVNWHEANAYCRYAGRRLPSEAEWETVASYSRGAAKRRYPWGDSAANGTTANLGGSERVGVGEFAKGDSFAGCRQMLGNVWEWTSSTFDPYPDFVRDPYAEYSEPWFGTHKVLRGGSFATPARLVCNTWRNFYRPERGDIFAGFRTCAIE
ncbi:MAG TPA: selenoneine synthase SenA [Burkholderiales bacterium]|nr:selenoneine synthase SenA [Burkholderiales bacterium]